LNNKATVESDVSDIWSKYLCLEKLALDDDYFDLGGTSLQAAQIFSEINNRLNVDLPITTLLEASTVRELSKLVFEQEATDSSSLVLLKEGDDQAPLFLFHPVGGTVLVYKDLVDSLNCSRPVYGIQASGLHENETFHTSVEDMAEYYADAITQIQSAGPYYLAGYSAGGVFAFATAQSLVARGHQIAYLGLINTHFGFRRTGSQVNVLKRGKAYLNYVFEHGLSAAYRDFSSYRIYSRKLQLAEKKLDQKGTTAETRLDKLVQQVLERKDTIDRYTMVQQLLQIAIKFYQPEKFPGQIVLYKTSDFQHNRPGEIGWSRQAGRKLIQKGITGTHLSLINQPEVHTLAACMHQDLTSSRRRSSTAFVQQ